MCSHQQDIDTDKPINQFNRNINKHQLFSKCRLACKQLIDSKNTTSEINTKLLLNSMNVMETFMTSSFKVLLTLKKEG